jgi:DHA2 family multidrug resistance protein
MCAIGGLQLMLDRGHTLDWFESREIVIEGIVAAVGFYFFLVHVLTTSRPFIDLHLYRNWNFCVGLVLIFFSNALPVMTMVLMPLLMQNVMGYPVIHAGIVMAPRGLGVLISTWLAPPFIRIIGPRLTVVVGLLFLIVMTEMVAGFAIATPDSLILISGLMQGLGMGLVMVPLNMIILTTLEARYITEAAMVSNLVRSVGSSIGVSVMVTVLSQSTQVVRSGLVEHINIFSPTVKDMAVGMMSDPRQALAAVDAVIEREASMTAFMNDFRLLTVMLAALVPMMFLFRGLRNRAGAAPASAHVEA